jgi:DNA-binding response OmpR family regulator
MKQPLRILFVGCANFHNRQFIDRLTSNDGVDFVSWISSGEKALSEYSNLLPDIIIVDALTDDMSGVEIARWLKEQDQQLRIVMVSEVPTMEFLYVSREMNLHGYFPKAISIKDLDQSMDDLQNNTYCYGYALAILIFPEWMNRLQNMLSLRSLPAFKSTELAAVRQQVRSTINYLR